MDFQLVTRTGRDFYEATSIMQNAIRAGDYDVAGHCMWELFPQYRSYLCKRLLIIAAEDCFGIINKEIEPLCDIGTEEALSKALSLMCECKKNRDADFFVCVEMHCDTPSGDEKHEIGKNLTTAIRKMDVVRAGRLAQELYQLNRKYMWDTLKTIAQVYYPHLLEEVRSLERCNEKMTKPNQEGIFAAKAIVLMWTKKNTLQGVLGIDSMDFNKPYNYDDIEIIKPIEDCPKVNGYFPERYYNWHTKHGKYDLRLDTIHATENNQKLLTPLELNLFDDCSWDRDLSDCLRRWNPLKRPIPYRDGKIKPEDKFPVK